MCPQIGQTTGNCERSCVPARPRPAPQRPAIGVPRELHLHLDGVSAAEIAAVLARRRGSANMPADEQDP